MVIIVKKKKTSYETGRTHRYCQWVCNLVQLLETLLAATTNTEHMYIQWPHNSFLAISQAKMDTYVNHMTCMH